MSDDRQKLKALLLSEELAQLKAIHQLLNDRQQLAEKISEVLDPAADKVIANNPDFQRKFSKVDPKSYVKAVKANKQTFIDALLPIIGPMIRKSVSSAIRRFVADVNRAVEMGISAKALKWRWQSFRTGVPFTEIVFNNTIEYQVQQVFLIDNHTGMLIEFVGHEEELLQDKEAMSAMLTAIQDFVKDAVSKEGEGLSAAELGDELVWLIHGNKANIAAVIKGAPTARLRDSMSSLLESIHLENYHQLEDQTQWNNSPELKTELDKLLLTKSQSDDEEQEPKGINYWPWLIGLTALLLWLFWTGYQHRTAKNQVTEQLNNTPGFVLQSLDYDDDQFIATGLQDPLADLSHLADDVVIISKPYVSLQDEIVARRIDQLLNQPTIQTTAEDQVITLSGSIDDQTDLQPQLQFIGMMPGVNQVINQIEVIETLTLDLFLSRNPPPHSVQVKADDQSIVLSGITTPSALADFKTGLAALGEVDDSAVTSINPVEVAQSIQQNPLKIINTASINNTQQAQLQQLITTYNQLLVVQQNAQLKLIARSDCQGSQTESNENNQLRLQMVYDYLQNSGLPNNQMQTEIMTCESASEEIDLDKIGVWFEVLP